KDRKPEKRFQEIAFGEYHLYQLNHKTTITDQATKQIELLDVSAIPVTRAYLVPSNKDHVAVVLEFKNSDTTVKGLGVPLPKGPVRVFQQGGEGDGDFEFVGADTLDHTPKDELVKLRLSYAFDVKAQRKTLAERVNQE